MHTLSETRYLSRDKYYKAGPGSGMSRLMHIQTLRLTRLLLPPAWLQLPLPGKSNVTVRF